MKCGLYKNIRDENPKENLFQNILLRMKKTCTYNFKENCDSVFISSNILITNYSHRDNSI